MLNLEEKVEEKPKEPETDINTIILIQKWWRCAI